MTQREKQIINLIKENPLITQEEIAETLNCARTSIAVHISNLMKKGVILGKKYIINEDPYILTIGGTNVDIQGKSYNSIVRYDSNPGSVTISFGGVGKNIAENIGKLGITSKLITALGDDIYGKDIKDYLQNQNLDISDSLFLKNQQTSMYVSILNDDNEMEMAVSSTDICKSITPEFLDTIRKKVTNAKLIVLDTNLEEETLRYVAFLRRKPNLILDTVSTKKALKVKDFIGRFHIIKPNRLEAEVLSDITIYGNDDLIRVGEHFLNKGVKKIFISLGPKGIFYMTEEKNGIIKIPRINTVSTTGAGDAFVAGISYGEYHDYDVERASKFGLGAALLTSLNEKTVSEHINVKNVENIIEEMEL
ncbi:winged helix-turn-helix transcriptional regulator [Leptotrichia sp. OH3620_COT-345]|uniref:PfkB family carbohydrate kinase n=1 Tax=Leptotrichia sp. OH3620_COT-345 TaxID=2491048 RepID=UPI000F64CDAE|nr:PfkB family carbohydrate kinase [Leptotrichia sp. OH3620_COT-345]RRD39671.1 winged helix-turn-helix transcriptional regulator [Leptotrichia sp. OH3620_COT-345]